jgi:hypothetical protein
MSTTIDMLAMRVETLEKQLALILKDQGDVVKSEPKKSKKEPKEPKEPKKETKKTKKSTEESSSDEEEKPKKKRGTNGYILFSNANRDDVKAQLQVGDEKPKNTEIMKQLAQMWQTISADEKAVWTAKAKEANVEDA